MTFGVRSIASLTYQVELRRSARRRRRLPWRRASRPGSSTCRKATLRSLSLLLEVLVQGVRLLHVLVRLLVQRLDPRLQRRVGGDRFRASATASAASARAPRSRSRSSSVLRPSLLDALRWRRCPASAFISLPTLLSRRMRSSSMTKTLVWAKAAPAMLVRPIEQRGDQREVANFHNTRTLCWWRTGTFRSGRILPWPGSARSRSGSGRRANPRRC